MKKVLIIAECEFGDSIYYHLAHLIPALGKSSDFVVEVMVPKDSPLPAFLAAHNIITHQMGYSGTLSRTDLLAIRTKLRDIKPDIIHTHSHFLGKLSGWFGRYKTVHTLHSPVYVPKWRRIFPFKQIFSPAKKSHARKIIAVNQATQKSLQDINLSSKYMRMIYNGVAPPKQHYGADIARLRVQFQIPENAFIATYITQLHEDNQLDMVVSTARELPYNVLTLIVSDGIPDENYEKHLRSRIARESLNNIKILPHSQLDEILAVTDVQICPGAVSSIPSHVLSGMSAGKPTVVTKQFDPFVIQDNVTGLTFEPGSVEWLDDAITRLKDDQAMYSRLAKEAKARHTRYFTAENMAASTVKVYKELV